MPNPALSFSEVQRKKRDRFTPALSYDSLTPAYDYVMQWVAREHAFKTRLVDQMNLKEGFRVLDFRLRNRNPNHHVEESLPCHRSGWTRL